MGATPGASASIFDKLSLDLSATASVSAPVIQNVNVEPINLGAILEPQIGPAESGGFLTEVPQLWAPPQYPGGGVLTFAPAPEGFRNPDFEQAFLDINPQARATAGGISSSAVLILAIVIGGAVLLIGR
jgi:hypothetical protein